MPNSLPQLLRTKLHVPAPRPSWLSRSRLTDRMDEGFKRKLILLSAPAGSGKSTLVVDWLHRQKIPAAWLSIDRSDSDPLQFLAYITAALQTINADISKSALMMLQSPQPPPADMILVQLINDATRIPGDTVLVLDDYHLIDKETVHNLMAFLLDNLPPQLHIIMSTRTDPAIPGLARLRSQNDLIELPAAELNFTGKEAAALFNTRLRIDLSLEDINLLTQRTEGWIAGIQLAAMSLAGRKDPSGFISIFRGQNRYIADYLTQEVLNRQTQQVGLFLLQTSILDRFCGSLCDAVTAQEDSHRILTDLENKNLFVVPLDDRRRWYRYHHLFADLLKQRLNTKHPDFITTGHLRASKWFETNGYKNEAVNHAFTAEDHVRAAQLIEDICEDEWSRDAESQLYNWLQLLPEELIAKNPILLVSLAGELFKNNRLDEAENTLQAAEQFLNASSPGGTQKEVVCGRIAVIRAYISSRKGDTAGTIRAANQALNHLPQRDLMWRSVAATILGFGYGWAGAGDLVKANQAFVEARQISKAAGNTYYEVFAGSCLASVLSMQARLKEAEKISRKSLQLSIDSGIHQTSITGSLYGNLGGIMCEWNDCDEGIGLIHKGIELSVLGRDPVILISCQINLLKAHFYRADHDAAAELLQDIKSHAERFRPPPWITNAISAFSVYLWLARGELDAALNWANEEQLRIDGEINNLRELEYLAYAHILAIQGRLDEAEKLLGRLIENAQAGGRSFLVIEMRLWRAMLYMAGTDTIAALDDFHVALKMAAPSSMIGVFISKGPPVEALLELFIEQKKGDQGEFGAGISSAYVQKLISAFKKPPPPEKQPLIDPLSVRELEVLSLIASGHSNREIAEKLYISLNTVKTHTKNINSKLNVNSRTKAAAKAKSLGLI